MKIVIDNKIPFINGVLEKYTDVVYLEGSKISKYNLMDADGMIIRTRTKCDASLLERTPVQFIASATTGIDHIDVNYCRSKEIVVAYEEGCNSSSVTQYIASALCHLSAKFGFSLSETTIGIIGVGNIGSKVARLCEALGMTVLLNDPPRERREREKLFVPLETILRQADIITLHVPLNRDGIDKTYHLVDEQLLSNLNSYQVLINTSRGEVINTQSIKNALKEKTLRGCVLDVWDGEPDIDQELLQLTDIGTPHIAGYSADGKANATSMSVRATSEYFGLELNGWQPQQIPVPVNTTIQSDCQSQNTEEVIRRCIQSTYDILADDRRLRNSPETFEQQREKYPLRREFETYTVELINAKNSISSIIKQLGFKIHN